ncbi:protein FAM110C [Ahaetulla prasina]|uniref:protein FAM110C n=1 Tax=Ahaetulla prasina TaxID=499056 RepID=UPI0026488F06|nr:protein FAM110C [Ahaetulla prasina]XP_058033629.1 protein FAM110C [Ahaetulla prasina]
MPTELSHMVRMHAISDFPSSLTARLLHKGPEYLRKQMEAANPSRKSAVERLAADKAKYVKSQQVISRKQVPAITLSSTSESSSETCSVESKKVARSREEKDTAGQVPTATELSPAARQDGPPIVRRNSGKRQIRPDSLVIYRQKCDFVRGQSQENTRGNLVRRLFQGSFKEKQLVSEVSKVVLKEETIPEVEGAILGKDTRHSYDLEGQNSPTKANPVLFLVSRCKDAVNVTSAPYDVKEMKQKGLQRSQSDISSRYSKSFSEFDTFFKNCGLEPEVIKDLGQETISVASDNFSFHLHSISGAASESDFTRHSDEEGLLEEELTEQAPSGTSVVERNARIIKWLYMCKKAKEANVMMQDLA